jgi:FkbM family methyltransferase
MTISEDDVLRRAVAIRNPFRIRRLSLLSHLHKAAFKARRRMSRRFVGKPAKRLFRLMLKLGAAGQGSSFAIALPGQPAREVAFDGRNTQFGALYLPQNQPIYEPETSVLLDCLVGDDDVFYDVGANWGWYALLIASRPGFAGRVHAFEPFPATFRDLARCVEEAGLAEVVTCHEVALADSDGAAAMGFSDGVQSGLARLGEAGGAEVRIAKLDSLFLPAPAVIKIDAEDHEMAVLAGAAATIAASRA